MIPLGHLVQGPLDRDKLAAAARALILRHEALRTRFELGEGTITAIVANEPNFGFHVVSLADRSLDAFRNLAIPLIFDHVDPREPGSLVRIVAADLGDCWRFTIAAHHAITDGFSRGVMNRELLKIYSGEELAPARSYYEFATSAAASSLLSPEAVQYVASMPCPVRLVGDSIGRGIENDAGLFTERDFLELSRPLRSLGKSIGATKFGVLAAIYAMGLRGYSGDPHTSSFFQAEGRTALGAPNSVVGPFSNTLPIDLTVDLDKPFAVFAASVSERARNAVALENEPILDRVLAEGKAPSVSINMFPPAGRIRAGTLDIGPREFLDRRTEFDLNLVWSEDDDVLTARAFYDGALLTEDRVQLFLGFQSDLLQAALADPQMNCRDIIRKARGGREVVLPQTSRDPAPAGRLHDRFFEVVARTPGATAVITTRERITYGDLALRVRRVLAALRSAGVGEGDRVAILAQRDPALIAAMLGVSASGAAFALIDATYPVERMRWMIERLGCHFLVEAGASLPEDLRAEVSVIAPASDPAPEADICFGASRLEACHMFTSGTTGRPKLVSHPDTTLQRFVAWQATMLDLPEPICCLMMAGLAHDPTLRDVFLPLSNGGTVAVPTPCEMTRPEELRALLARARCNVVRFSPTTARLLTAGVDDAGGLGSLKAIFWGGERLPHSEVRKWHGLVPGARQIHIFGTTETPQAFLFHEIDPAAHWSRSLPLGRPLPWTGVRLVDEEGAPVSSGEVGEIVASLADRVVGVSEKLPIQEAGVGCHHFTGDIGYQMRDGEIYFVGRRDGQIKINGFRVELAEIESTAEAVKGVERAHAMVVTDRILLFVESNMADITERSLRAALSRTLPTYMVPALVVVSERFPSTPNGKVDGPALLAFMRSRMATAAAAAAPGLRGPAEHLLAQAFASRTGRSDVTRDDTLEDLGADSLTSIELQLELEAKGFVLPEDWPFMPISELAGFLRTTDKSEHRWASLGKTSRVETFILLRAMAIVAVVFFHTGYNWTGGASITLFVLAGYSFGRLQLKAIAQDDHSGRVWVLLGRLVVPLVLMILLYVGVAAYRGLETHPSTLFFYRNLTELVDATILGVQTTNIGMPWLWFLHVYVQVFVLIGLLLSFPAPRRQLRDDPWRAVAVFFVIIHVVGLLVIVVLSVGPLGMLETARLLHRSPVAILPFLALGALISCAQTPMRKVASLSAIAIQFGLVWVLYPDHRELWWIVALAACAYVPYVTLPGFVARPVVMISAYSLMIYLAHPFAFLVFYKFFGSEGAAGLVSVVFQIGTGIFLGILMRWVLDFLGVNRLAGLRVTFFPSQKIGA